MFIDYSDEQFKQLQLYAKQHGLTVEQASLQLYRNRNAKVYSDCPSVKKINNVVELKNERLN